MIAELGEGTPAVLVLSRRREHGIDGVVVLTADEQNLIDQLVAVARAPWIAVVPPPDPEVPWSRIARDVRRTAGRDLALTLRWEEYPAGGFWMCDVSLDGVTPGGMSVNWDDNHPKKVWRTLPTGCVSRSFMRRSGVVGRYALITGAAQCGRRLAKTVWRYGRAKPTLRESGFASGILAHDLARRVE